MNVPLVDVDLPTAVGAIVKVSVIVASAATAHLVMRRRASAAARHLMWSCALASLAALPALSTLVPSWPLDLVTAMSAATPSAPLAEAWPATRLASSDVQVTAPGTLRVGSTSAVPIVQRIPWTSTLLGLYAGGVLFFLLRLAIAHVTVRRIAARASDVTDPAWRAALVDCSRALAVRGPVRLLRSREHTIPMAFGIARPAILMPAIADTWTDERVRAVLLHELAHVVRRDCLTQTMAALVCATYWMHPGAWLVARRLHLESELACDDLVLVSGTQPRDYAGHLLELAYAFGGRRAPALVVGMARPRQLEGRMLAILDAARNRTTPRMRGRLVGAAVTTALLIPLAALETTTASAHRNDGIGVLERESNAVADGTRAPHAPDPSETAANQAAPKQDTARARDALPGTWEVRPATEDGYVHLRMTEHDSNWGSTVPLTLLEGLSRAQLSGAGSVQFKIRRDAGTFTFEGVFRQGVGVGTYSFDANPAFAGELTKRGIAQPTARDQYELARSDVGLAFVDELAKQSYARPAIADLVRAGHHGVHLEYLQAMGALGYRLGVLEALIEQRDHGVTPEYVKELAAEGYARLSADEVRRARDHGVSSSYVHEMRALFPTVTLDQLVTARDHGVKADFIRELGELDKTTLSLEAATNARDHGMSPSYVRELNALGYRGSLAELTKARDHGVSVEFVRELASLGYRDLPLQKIIQVRDHGVTPSYVREMKELGYNQIDIDELVRLRDHGVTPERIRRANERAGTHLPLDMIKALAAGGMR